MKKYIYLLLFSLPLLAASCSKDNYDEPQETFRGKFIDKQTGEPFQTAIGNTGIRIRMMEYSWSDNPQPYDMNVKMDGTFNNTKVFKGEYGITPSGAFVPLEEERIKISGTVEKTWEVEPLLRVEWVGEPVVNADGTVDVKVKILRGTDNPAYQQDLAEAWLFVSENMYVGDFSYSPNYSTRITSDLIKLIPNPFDQVITIRTGQPSGFTPDLLKFQTEGVIVPDLGPDKIYTPFPAYSRKYFLRFGARTTRQFDGTNRYNYTTVKEITTIAR